MILTEDQLQALDNAALCSGFLTPKEWDFIAGTNAKRNVFRFRNTELSHGQDRWLKNIDIKLQEVGMGHRYAMQCASANV